MSELRPKAQTPIVVRSVRDGSAKKRSDVLATEEPLEIRLKSGPTERTVAITMRTPGNDFELAVGFLYGEGVLRSREDLDAVRYCVGPDATQLFNIATVDLRGPMPDIAGLDRHFYTTSACGVCGKASLDQIEAIGGPPIDAGPRVDASLIRSLPERLRAAQKVFERTGGLHAAALFDSDGDVLCVREDVGRHNALDKVVGWGLMEATLPFSERILLVSGRASFELVQKAVRAGASILCAVSAPSSLAVDVAVRFGITLIGFLRDEGFNIYTGEGRIAL
jgi:FdhD protein